MCVVCVSSGLFSRVLEEDMSSSCVPVFFVIITHSVDLSLESHLSFKASLHKIRLLEGKQIDV